MKIFSKGSSRKTGPNQPAPHSKQGTRDTTRDTGAPAHNSPRRKKGIALVTVMAILAALTILVVAILSLAGNELDSSKTYADNVKVRRLSDIVTSVVIGQIRQATRPDSDTNLFGAANATAWASQPGMIRVFNTSGFAQAYKLYSSSQMVIDEEDQLRPDSIAAKYQGWQSDPSRFVDINRPEIIYDVEGKEVNRHFPILDPRSRGRDQTEGFDYGNFPGVDDEKRLPMPVEWMYVLEDGSVGTLNRDHKFVGTAQPSTENPIVSRIAFWVDDESCKINVNTASEGVAWYVPRSDNDTEREYAVNQPVTNEVQRYPGHPAMTCLSSVFFPNHYPDPSGAGQKRLESRHLEALYELAPKVVFGGTEGGTKKGTQPITFDRDRLYSTVDDVIFNINREENQLMNLLREGSSESPLEKIERARHFLTVHSRAPETNIHGYPRISMWPLHESSGNIGTTRTVFDETIAFCTTLRGRDKFFFQRSSQNSRHYEFYGRAGRANVNLYQYLISQVQKPVPGYGASLARKYGGDKKFEKKPNPKDAYLSKDEYVKDYFAIGVWMFDYMRGTNIHDGNLKEPYANLEENSSFGQYSGINLIGRNLQSSGGSGDQTSNWYKPTLEPRGPGRMFTLSEVALVCYVTDAIKVKTVSEEGNVTFTNLSGGGSNDSRVIEVVLRGQHPHYYHPKKNPGGQWRNPGDGINDGGDLQFQNITPGSTYYFVEVGIVPEVFAVHQGYHQIHPRQAMRLLTGKKNSSGNRGGFDGTLDGSLHLNGVPLVHWGIPKQGSKDMEGPLMATIKPGASINSLKSDLPGGWYGWGGSGGYRIFRFGRFELPGEQGGFAKPPNNCLANGDGGGNTGLAAWYCQNGVIVKQGEGAGTNLFGGPTDDGKLTLSQHSDNPVQIVIFDNGIERSDRGNLVQVFNLNFAEFGVDSPSGGGLKEVSFPMPEPNSGNYAGWTRRFNRAASDSSRSRVVDVLEDAKPVRKKGIEADDGREGVKSLIVSHGDYRHVAGKRNVPQELMQPHPEYQTRRASHSMVFAGPRGAVTESPNRLSDDIYGRSLVEGANYDKVNRPDFTFDPKDRDTFAPLLSKSYDLPIDPSITRDFDNGTGSCPDGAYAGKPDDGADDPPGSSIFSQKWPYFDVAEVKDFRYEDKIKFNFSPNRMIAGPVAFGSIPSLTQANAPWTCLLFRPNVSDEDHFGEAGWGLKPESEITSRDGMEIPQYGVTKNDQFPADHLWLDLFWMPVVQPYPISEPFSTAGKVNLNYQMMPFTYIKRATALHAVLKSERIRAYPTKDAGSYKLQTQKGYVHQIDADETMKQWDEKFEDGEIFKTGSEVCEMFMVPQGERWTEGGRSMRNFWKDHGITGDNTIESVYNGIYPRVTTQSNVFKIYMTVQILSKVRSTRPDEFIQGEDKVMGEYRGSVVVERYLDPNSRELPEWRKDYEGKEKSADYYYQWRVVNTKQFAAH